MQIHEIRPTHQRKQIKRVGRGGKRGTYCGRGRKGQKARESRNMVPVIRALIKRYPKLRGYRFKSRQEKFAVVNLGILEKKFQAGETVNPQTLLKHGLIRRIKGRAPRVKILAEGQLTKSLIFENCQLSKKAQQEVTKVNGPR